MFSVCRERPFFPIVAIQNALPGPEILSRPDAPDDPSPPLKVRFGTGSDFGFHKPSRFFDLPSAHSESTAAGFGIRSVEVIR